MSTTATELQIAFPKQEEGTALAVPPPPPAPLTGGIGSELARSGVNRPAVAAKQLVCKDLLKGDTRARADADAAKLYQEMLANSQVFMTYGTAAIEGSNQLTDRLLHDVGRVDIPELRTIIHNLNKGLRGIRTKYDVTDPKVYKKYTKVSGRFKRLVFRGKTMIELMMEDINAIEKQLDKTAKDLGERQDLMVRNVGYYDEIYEENEAEIGKIIYAIGVMELIRDLAANEANAITPGDASLGDRQGERKAQLAEFVSNMETKIAEYKGRLFISWATSPQVRNMRTLNVGMAERLNEFRRVTIPTMKQTIVQWRMLVQTQDAAAAGQLLRDSANATIQQFAQAAAIGVGIIADEIQTPTLTPQSIAAMADSIVKQADGIITAMDNGEKRRQEMDQAILEAHTVLSNTSERVSDALIEHAVNAATKPLEIETSVSGNGQTAQAG